MSGPIAPPSEKLMIHTLMAVVRWRGSRNMLRMSESVERSHRGAGDAEQRTRRDEHGGASREGGEYRSPAEEGGSDQQQSPSADADRPSVPAVISEPATRKP
jgi:hypothetical protein